MIVATTLLLMVSGCKKDNEYMPVVITTGISAITENTATSGGNVTTGTNITARGIVWNTSTNPSMNMNQGKTTEGTGTGNFVSNLTSLTPNTTYYVRAYVSNSSETIYGNQISFNTNESHAQNSVYYIEPPKQTDPIMYQANGTFSIGLNKNQDFTLNLTSDIIGSIHICGGRHIRVYGNGHKVSGLIRLLNNGGSSNSSATTGGGDVGEGGSFYIEGVYWPKHQYLYGSAGAIQDCITIYNNGDAQYNDGRNVKCVIIQRCRAKGIWGSNGAMGHGDFFQVQGGGTAPLLLGYTYISNCTVSTGYTGFQYYKYKPGGSGTLYDNPRMRMVNVNWEPYFYTDPSKEWCNIKTDGSPIQGPYFAIGLDNDPNSQPGPGLHMAVLETYAQKIERNGGERKVFNPNNDIANNTVYEDRPGGTTIILNDRITRTKSAFMAGAIKIGSPAQGDFMSESEFNPATWKNIGVPGGPVFYVSYQDGKLPEELGIPFH